MSAKLCDFCGCARNTGSLFCSRRCASLGRIGLSQTRHSDAQVVQFTALWDAGEKLSEIVRQTGIGKNSCASLRKRLGLAPRGTPIGRATERPARKTLQERRRKERLHQEVVAAKPPSFADRPPLPPQCAPVVTPVPPALRLARDETCPFVLSDGKPWRFCDVPLARGQRYCAEHGRRVFVTVRPGLEAAA
jgi:GcrA cell cycle regulator